MKCGNYTQEATSNCEYTCFEKQWHHLSKKKIILKAYTTVFNSYCARMKDFKEHWWWLGKDIKKAFRNQS